jgi:hypothetical protein
MVKNNVSVQIEKHRPYPHTIYQLSKQLPTGRTIIFKFALKLADTVSQIGSYPPTDYAFGCCKNKDNTCFKNADRNKCDDLNLDYNPITQCKCPEPVKLHQSAPITNCDQTYEFYTKDYTGPSRQHGESWCSYDSAILTLSDFGGIAYVGSRSYQHSCIDGKEIIEECRDYRDELCTESTENNLLQATCRKNRWEDCSRCESEQCCLNTQLRDCTWDPNLETENHCFPIIPPGFKFWDRNGEDVCNVASNSKICEGLSCSSKWVDDSAVYCYAMGDCGNYRNIADKLTYTGFFNSDPIDQPSSFIFMPENLNVNPREQSPPKKTLTLDPETRKQNQIIGTFPHPASRISSLFSVGLQYLDYIGSINPFDFINPFKDPPEVKILDYSFCSSWEPPLGGSDCLKCHEDPFIPCSEYRCKSLGQLCNYETTFDGFGNCTAINLNDDTHPTITFNPDLLNDPYQSTPSQIVTSDKIINGVTITPRIRPYSSVRLAINTSENTRCNLNYIPNLELLFFPAFWFGESTFETSHNMSFRLPEGYTAPSKVYDTLNITHLAQIADIVFNLEIVYNQYMNAFSGKFATIKTFTGIDVRAIIDPFKDMALAFLQPFVDQFAYLHSLASTILEGIENNNYYLFVSCTDRAGNRNTEDFFINIGINNTYNDTDPVEYLDSQPANASQIRSGVTNVSFNLYINEPASCKYAKTDTIYDSMQSTLECPSSPFQIDPFDGGSYRCHTTLPFVNNNTIFYFRCKDNPPRIKQHTISFLRSDNFSRLIGEDSRYFNLTEPNQIDIAASFFIGIPEIYIATDQVKLNLYLDTLQSCKYSNETTEFSEMTKSFDHCTLSGDLDIGIYKCPVNLPTKNNTIYNFACSTLETKPRNPNPKSYVVNLTRAKKLQNIIISPEKNSRVSTPNPELAISLIKPISETNIVCGYTADPIQGYHPMQKEGNFLYKTTLNSLTEGFHTYYIECTDDNSDSFRVSTTFAVEIGGF